MQSIRGGNNKKKPQKHQNKRAFKPMFDDNAIKRQTSTPLDNLCKKCVEQIKWKLQFAKYKPLKNPVNCQKCNMKTVIKSYRHACDPCAKKEKICAKCMQKKEIEPYVKPDQNKGGVDANLLKEMQDYLDTMRERSRRKVKRLINNKEITYNRDIQKFEYIETGKPLTGLVFKGDAEEDDDLDFLDSDEDDMDFGDNDDQEEGEEDDDEEEKEEEKL